MNQTERILNMVKEGKISPEEAETLLNAINKPEKKGMNEPSGCNLRIRVISNKPGEDAEKPGTIVKVNLPIKIISLLAKTTGKLNLNMAGKNDQVRESLSNYGIDLGENGEIKDVEALTEALEKLCEMAPVELVNVIANEDDENTIVKIWIE